MIAIEPNKEPNELTSDDKKYVFAHDYLGQRVRTRVCRWDTQQEEWSTTADEDRRMIYFDRLRIVTLDGKDAVSSRRVWRSCRKARTRARTTSGSFGHASTTTAGSGSIGVDLPATAPDSAPGRAPPCVAARCKLCSFLVLMDGYPSGRSGPISPASKSHAEYAAQSDCRHVRRTASKKAPSQTRVATAPQREKIAAGSSTRTVVSRSTSQSAQG